jgi:hypothetical protein
MSVLKKGNSSGRHTLVTGTKVPTAPWRNGFPKEFTLLTGAHWFSSRLIP